VSPADWIALARPFTLLAPIVGTLAGSFAAAAALGASWLGPRLALALLAAAAATMASNAWNQCFDVEIDRVNRPDRPVPSGRVTPHQALAGGCAFALLALVLGALVSWAFLACVAAGLLGTWIYSAPPFRTKRRRFGALLTIAIPRGLLVPVAGWSVVAVPSSSDPWALGLVGGLYVFGAAATKDFADVDGDRAHGCDTLPVAWGPRKAARFVAPFLVLPFLLLVPLAATDLVRAPVGRIAVVAAVLLVAGGLTAGALLADPVGLGTERRPHAAWIGMYLTLLLYQAGFALAYA
jgi:4-hydroxybenzoate polyprenyltransferase